MLRRHTRSESEIEWRERLAAQAGMPSTVEAGSFADVPVNPGETMAPVTAPTGAAAPKELSPRRGIWRMGLVVTASALCGGIAVVLWNRRLLTKMREVVPVARSRQQTRLWEDDL